MNNLIERHYQATKRRGKINKKTTITDFLNKMIEEDTEMIQETIPFQMLENNNLAQETVDSIMVRINMLRKQGIDFIKELEINTIWQETRND